MRGVKYGPRNNNRGTLVKEAKHGGEQMQVIFAGGASSVGASCVAVELAGRWFVVDAGVRVDRKADPLPDLALLEEKDVQAIFVTHAHADHIGALPLLHQAFPTVPIFASRATALLMEVMLADALKVMTRRAVEEMELPLYPEALVSGMLNRVRTLPVGEPFTVSELPGVTISASRAGHIAGAVSLGFTAQDGSLVISGDISITPQRTVLGATPPPVQRPDLLVLESTYGARLHPNRQSEEQRLAQAVAAGLAEGGHVLIPCFGLGRGQELLLLLQDAQEKGQIADFPIYVDGLVRRVCDTYQLLPEALAPRLQRQIRKGYLPFTGPNVTFVRDERHRERILAGPPACIVSSSGMLTGGPSVWYATRLLSNPNASILITGYQDEEAPGRRLLDLAEHKKNTLDIAGQTLPVLCHVAKYSLSAHADGGELAAYAAALQPREVALVHGDQEARVALRTLLTGTEVMLPVEGNLLGFAGRAARRSSRASQQASAPLSPLPVGVGEGQIFDYSHVEQLWQAVSQVPSLRIVTARELALVWYGEATEENTLDILETFAQDYEQRYFIRQHALEEAYRVRGAADADEMAGDFLSELPGSMLLLLVSIDSAKPAICRAIEPGAAVRVYLPKGVSQERNRYPFSSILEVLGPAPQEVLQHAQAAGAYLADLVKTMRRIRRSISAHALAEMCEEGTMYTLSELCAAIGLAPQSFEDRLALAKLLQQYSHLFTQSRSVFDGEGLTLYALAPEWREALAEPEEQERPDQSWILSVVEQHLGTPPDLYRRGVDPDTGVVTLGFYFPDIAGGRYAEAIAAAEEEVGVPITIAPQAHQGELAKAALHHLPPGLQARKSPSLYLDRSVVSLDCQGQASAQEIASAQSYFFEETGWHLEIVGATIASPASQDREALQQSAEVTVSEADRRGDSSRSPSAVLPKMNQHDVIQYARQLLGDLPDFSKAGVELATSTVLLRFHFPLAAQERYADLFAQLEEETGWQARLHPMTNQNALVEAVSRHIPPELRLFDTPSLRLDQQVVAAQYLGDADAEAIDEAQQYFLEETGWRLQLFKPGQKLRLDASKGLPVEEAMDQAKALFADAPGFYRVGADAVKGNLWLHFHFPDKARQLYAELINTLAAQSGWRVYVYPYAHRKTLIEAATRLLPSRTSIMRRPYLDEKQRKLKLTIAGEISAEMQEEIRHAFAEETGWQLELSVSRGLMAT